MAVTPSKEYADASCVLPIRASRPNVSRELVDYLRWLSARVETIVVDGSEPDVFAAHARAWGSLVRHAPPDPGLVTPMGKVGGVLTGVRLATREKVVVADDDIRYDEASLRQVVEALDRAEVVRPQNYFSPMPWHARWDTSRMLLNRLFGGDWPGTLGVRRSALLEAGGYDGGVMFENLELVRTVRAAGGREEVLLDAFVLRRPCSARHFWSQRVRQAYDELARPGRLAVQLAVLPAAVALVARGRWRAVAAGAAGAIALAEIGRRRANGRRVFPMSASLFAPAWLAERAVCAWLAVGACAFLGGIPYRGGILRHAATPMRRLRARRRRSPRGLARPTVRSPLPRRSA
jgi:hypothetical protein